jgi:drug/metabolite transporter (DMT)-like permease
VWLLVLQRLEVGIAYPMLSLNFVLITLVARYLFHEAGRPAATGWASALVMAGVLLLGATRMSRYRGFTLAFIQRSCWSARAQLGMRWSMTRLP